MSITYEELDAQVERRFNIYIFDFNHTLEEGSEIALTGAINSIRKENDHPDVGIDEVLELYNTGVSIDAYVQKFCPWANVVEISKRVLEFTRQSNCMKPSEGAVEVLRILKERRHILAVMSAIREPIVPYLDLLNLREYFTHSVSYGDLETVHRQLPNIPAPDYIIHFLRQPLSVEQTKAYFSYLICRQSIPQEVDGYLTKPDRRFFIDDSELCVKVVKLTNELIEKEWEHYPQFGVYPPRPKIESVHYNPKGTPLNVKSDHEIKRLQELLTI